MWGSAEVGPSRPRWLYFLAVHKVGPRRRTGCIDGGVGEAQQGSGHVNFYIGVDDAQAALEQVGRLGGKTIQPPVQVPRGVTFALFADPKGHVVGLVKE